MAVIYEENLSKLLKLSQKNIYILFGDDGYLKNMYKNKISRSVCESDDVFNFQTFREDCDLQDVYDAVLQFPMMADQKCVILDDYDFEHCKAEDFNKLCTVLKENPDSCVLILFFDGVNSDYKKSGKFKTIVDLAEKNNGVACELSHRSIPELVKMLTEGAKKRNCTFETNAAKYLVETAGQDINILVNELEKLCNFIKEGEITKQTVEKVSIKTVEAKIFTLSQQIINCNIDLAMKTIDDLFFTRVEPIIILSTVSGFYVDMYRLFAGKKKGMGINEVAEAFDYKSRKFALEKAMPYIKNFDSKKFSLSFQVLCNADKLLKSFSADAKTVLEQAVIRLCYIIAKGESVD